MFKVSGTEGYRLNMIDQVQQGSVINKHDPSWIHLKAIKRIDRDHLQFYCIYEFDAEVLRLAEPNS